MAYDRDAIIDRDDHTCQRCGEAFFDSRPLEVSHDVARSEGGSDDPNNLETLCIACHAEKDGWEVGDFDDTAARVARVASYVRDEGYDGLGFLGRVASLLGVSPTKASDLLDEHL